MRNITVMVCFVMISNELDRNHINSSCVQMIFDNSITVPLCFVSIWQRIWFILGSVSLISPKPMNLCLFCILGTFSCICIYIYMYAHCKVLFCMFWICCAGFAVLHCLIVCLYLAAHGKFCFCMYRRLAASLRAMLRSGVTGCLVLPNICFLYCCGHLFDPLT